MREPLKDKSRIEHILVTRYIAEINWEEWEKNDQVAAESAEHKILIQTAKRMKNDGMTAQQISRYTGEY